MAKAGVFGMGELQASFSAKSNDGAHQLPLVSCVMPTYGRPDFVDESIRMFLAQDYPNKELIILNDCADQHFECTSPNVRVINSEQRYPTLGEKRNAAIEAAKGEVIAVWDDDDVYLPWRISFSLAEMKRHKTEFYRPEEFWAYWGEETLHDNRSTPGWVNHAFVLFTKSLWRQVGGYPIQNLNEDSLFFGRIHQRLNSSFLAYPLNQEDRFFVLRGKSKYAHMSIGGGQNPLNLTPGRYDLQPAPIADEQLREQVAELIQEREFARASPSSVSAETYRPLLSICVALKNRSRLKVDEDRLELFPNFVRSLAEVAEDLASLGELELVVADFQSEDWPLGDWLSDATGRLQTKVISLKDRFSRGKGINVTVANATSDRIFVCDADMLVEAVAVRRAIEVIDAGKAWFPTYQCLNRQGQPESWQDLSHGMVGLRRELFEQAGPIPEFESWGGEDDLFHEAVARHVTVVRERTPYLKHQWHPESSRHEYYANPRQSDYQQYKKANSRESLLDEAPAHRFHAIHPHWVGEVHFFANQRMMRPGIDHGSFEMSAERIVLKWDRWEPEILVWDESTQAYRDPVSGFRMREIPMESPGDLASESSGFTNPLVT
ncbi:glycosyltransferase family 2 protein [Blastopirellula marina]|uniref:Glycosyltransferase 2-like domain-containing protein n=1 Tax=Blastopirellula marina TaxID=124 RepID=A0A2S8GHK7_9BACT|nr:glycosyltransferase family 2 protein [Blastopirellula marina]PQO43820.1 hypothetical protein C5Y93_21785 [Blastopirellula marina]